MKYTISVADYGQDVVYTIRLVGTRPPLPLAEQQAPFNVSHVHWLKGGKKPKTDWMRERSYKGEKELCNSEQKRWSDFRKVAEYLGSLMATEWFGRRWPNFRELRMIYRRGTVNAHAGPKHSSAFGVIEGSMTLSTWAIGDNDKHKMGGEAVVLHELAHAITPKAHEHSPLWARTYMELVKFRMGVDSYRLLKTGFDAQGVRFRPYRQLTGEQRQALRDRFVARGLNQRPTVATVVPEGVLHAAQ